VIRVAVRSGRAPDADTAIGSAAINSSLVRILDAVEAMRRDANVDADRESVLRTDVLRTSQSGALEMGVAIAFPGDAEL
jgi:hypothetical protein